MASERQTLQMLSNQIRLGMSRATVREFDDDHDMQEIKYADVYHSETPSNFERWQMVGLTATPLKQDEGDGQQQADKKSGDQEGDWNHDQPKEPAAEAVMMYPGGSRSHPIAMVDDRRVRPYKVPEGATALYAASGTGQMLYHNDDGSHLVVTNNPKYGKNQQQKDRYASVRHVQKQPQQRKFQQQGSSGSNGGGGGASASTHDSSSSSGGGGSGDYKHEGEKVLTEHRCTKNSVETRDGDSPVGVYTTDDKKWNWSADTHHLNPPPSSATTRDASGMLVQIMGNKFTAGLGHFMKQVTAAPPSSPVHLTTKGYVDSIFAALGITIPSLPQLPMPPLPPGITLPPGFTPPPSSSSSIPGGPGMNIPKMFADILSRLDAIDARLKILENR
jgi:phage gp45-like